MASLLLRFRDFELDPAEFELRRAGHRVRLERKPLELLILLAEKRGTLVSREEIIQRVWGDDVYFDAERGVNNAVRKIRAALHDESGQPQFVETVVGRGYRFIAPLNVAGNEGTTNLVPAAPSSDVAVAPSRPPTLPNVEKPPEISWLRSLIFPVGSGLLAFIGVAAVVLGLNVQGWRDRLFVYAARQPIQSLAILPLANFSGDREQEYFADGLTEALITELGKTRIPRVISRQSVMQYKGSKKPLQEIARELKVDAVLEGTVARSGDRVRITVRLDRVSPEGQLWASSYDRSARDILGLQDEIARAVTDEIQVKLTPQESARLASVRPVDPEAHDGYLRGRYILGLAPAHLSKLTDKTQYDDLDIQAAIGDFKHAIEIDPAYAMAYAGLADAYITLGNPVWGGHSPKETLFDAKMSATKALGLDSSLPEAHFSLAQTLEYEWNWPEAEKEFKLALNLNPNYADAHLEYGRFLQAMGQNGEALREMNKAMALDPFGIKTRVLVAWVTWASRQYDLALPQFKSLGDDWGVMCAYIQKGMYPEALAALERWKLDHPAQARHPRVLGVLAGIYGQQGRKREAGELIDEIKKTARNQYVSGWFFAQAYVGLGQKDQAIAWLERAYEEHDQWMVYVASNPFLDPLHSEPRFQALLSRMNFPL